MEITVRFKSHPCYFFKERDGLKPNTIRIVDDMEDERFKHLMDEEATHIEIVNTETSESFIREITDVTIWREDNMLISWKHENSCKDGKYILYHRSSNRNYFGYA